MILQSPGTGSFDAGSNGLMGSTDGNQGGQDRDNEQAGGRLLDSGALFAKLFHASPLGISITRVRDAVLVDVNNAWLETTGFTREEVIGRTRQEINLWVDLAERDAVGKALREAGSLRNVEVRYRRKSGEHSVLFGAMELVEVGGKTYTLAISFDISERKRAEDRIQHLATHDVLTDLPNRVLLMDRLNHAIVMTERRGGQLALLFVDLDRIKAVNDKLGHSVGDSLLRDVAVRLQQVVREVDTVARLGGDEFVVLLDDVAHADEAGLVAEKIVGALHTRPFIIEHHRLHATCSIGISLYPAHAANADALLRNADAAMYKAKERGRNGYRFFGAEPTSLSGVES